MPTKVKENVGAFPQPPPPVNLELQSTGEMSQAETMPTSYCPRCGKLRRYCLCGGKPATIPADALTVAIRAEIAAARAAVRGLTVRRG